MVILEELLHCVDLYNCLCEWLVTQLCPTLWDPIDCNLPGCSVHGILQARILERVAISTSRESSWHRDWTCVSCIASRFFTHWVIREALTIVSVQFSSSVVSDSLATPWTAVRQASLSITNSRSLLRLTSIELVLPSNHLILCHPLQRLVPSKPQPQGCSGKNSAQKLSLGRWSFHRPGGIKCSTTRWKGLCNLESSLERWSFHSAWGNKYSTARWIEFCYLE